MEPNDVKKLAEFDNYVESLEKNVKNILNGVSRAGNDDRRQIENLKDTLIQVDQQLGAIEEKAKSLPALDPSALQIGSKVSENDDIGSALGLILDSYSWQNKVVEYSAQAATTLNACRRSTLSTHRSPMSSQEHAIFYRSDQLLSALQQAPGISIERRIGTSHMVLVFSINNVCRCWLGFHGMAAEWAVALGWVETSARGHAEPEAVLPSSESRHEVFRALSRSVSLALLHFRPPGHAQAQMSLRYLTVWLRSFASLFSASCKACRRHLRGGLPPTWRDLKNYEPFHEECRCS